MPTARIITRFPDRAAPLRKTLVNSGYKVEIIPPERAGQGFADLEYDLDSMPEFASEARSRVSSPPIAEQSPALTPKREFSLAPQLHALKTSWDRIGQHIAEKLGALRVAVSARWHAWEEKASKHEQLREQERLETERRREQELAAKREADRIAAERTAIARPEREQHEAELRHQAEVAAERRAAELAAQREAERITAEQAAIARREREQRDAELRREAEATAERRAAELAAQREAEHQRLVEAELERRRREQETLEFARAEALREEAQPQHVSKPSEAQPVLIPQRRLSLRERWDDFSLLAYNRMREWRELHANNDFPDTRDYAWRQALPVAAGVAIAFALGWGLAINSSRQSAPLHAAPAPTSANVTAVAAPQPTPVPVSVRTQKRPMRSKPSPRVLKSKSAVSRRQTRTSHSHQDDVVIVRHKPKRELIARSNPKNGVKTISDME